MKGTDVDSVDSRAVLEDEKRRDDEQTLEEVPLAEDLLEGSPESGSDGLIEKSSQNRRRRMKSKSGSRWCRARFGGPSLKKKKGEAVLAPIVESRCGRRETERAYC